jgi:hypothetical protein
MQVLYTFVGQRHTMHGSCANLYLPDLLSEGTHRPRGPWQLLSVERDPESLALELCNVHDGHISSCWRCCNLTRQILLCFQIRNVHKLHFVLVVHAGVC